MSSQARVKSLQALWLWKGTLKRFGGETLEALQRIEAAIRRAEEWLQQGLRHWRRQLELCRQEVAEAEGAVRDCLEDDDADCSALEDDLDKARSRLRRAEEEVTNRAKWLQAVNQAVGEYRAQAQRMGAFMAIDLPRADAFQERAIANIEAYLATGRKSGSTATLGSEALGTTSRGLEVSPWAIDGSEEEVQKIHSALKTLDGTKAGSSIAKAIEIHRTLVRFDHLKGYGHFDTKKNEIVLNKELESRSVEVIAAHLAHEGSHVTGDRTLQDEYLARKREVVVWTERRGDQEDEYLDLLTVQIGLLSEAEYLDLLKEQPPYRHLPDKRELY